MPLPDALGAAERRLRTPGLEFVSERAHARLIHAEFC
jgi:hypothetical protein